MRNLLCIILILCLLSCDDGDAAGPYSGSWQFNSSTVSASFNIKGQSGNYSISEITVNGTTWENSELKDDKGAEIGQIILLKKASETNVNNVYGLVFVNCKRSGNVIMMDSAVYQVALDKTIIKGETITKK